jgi:hypothetical protein
MLDQRTFDRLVFADREEVRVARRDADAAHRVDVPGERQLELSRREVPHLDHAVGGASHKPLRADGSSRRRDTREAGTHKHSENESTSKPWLRVNTHPHTHRHTTHTRAISTRARAPYVPRWTDRSRCSAPTRGARPPPWKSSTARAIRARPAQTVCCAAPTRTSRRWRPRPRRPHQNEAPWCRPQRRKTRRRHALMPSCESGRVARGVGNYTHVRHKWPNAVSSGQTPTQSAYEKRATLPPTHLDVVGKDATKFSTDLLADAVAATGEQTRAEE